MLTREQLQRAAGEMGFPVDSLEKVWMLVRLLNMMTAHPFLGPRVALKGGTALNLFVFDVPRLSVDIDVNYVLITHGHGDHVGDSVAIAKRTGATVIANFELANMVAKDGCEIHPMHIGGKFNFDFGSVKLTIAHHGGGAGEDASRYTGPPVGFLITIGGKVIYHPGDTGLFYDMKLIGDMNDIDLAFLPIGDNFTMGIDDAAKAAEFLQAKIVVPFHYGTWPVIDGSPEEFASKVSTIKADLMAMLRKLKAEGKRIVAYGAAGGMATTLLAYMEIDKDLIEYAVDINHHKHGKWTSGSRLEIRPAETLLEDKPDVVLLLAWNFADEIMEQQKAFRDQGGQFLVPVPVPRLV